MTRRTTALTVIAAPAGLPTTPVVQAESDEQLIAMWLHKRPATTREAYVRDLARFQACVPKPLRHITLGDLQRYADTLTALAPASQARYLSAIKSLFAFGCKLGYLPFDVGRPLKAPERTGLMAERILSEADTQRMIALERHPRNHAILRLLYNAAIRVSELCALRWRHCQERQTAGQITVVRGKGRKTRAILISADTWEKLMALRGEAGQDDPIFVSRQGGGVPLQRAQVRRIVLAAARRAGIAANVSSHWLRHAHASHALDRGAPIALVQATLGHKSVATTGMYLHARPTESSGKYLAI